jgi:hypothetical protein
MSSENIPLPTDAVLIAVSYLIYWAGRTYLPDHVRVITTRAKYYLYGPEELSW